MSDYTATVIARLDSATTAPIRDGRTQTPPDDRQAHAIVYGGLSTPQQRALTAQSRRSLHVWQVVCVSNNPLGCRTLTGLLVAALDGFRIGTDHLDVVGVSDPLEDRDDASQWRWSSTITVHLLTRA